MSATAVQAILNRAQTGGREGVRRWLHYYLEGMASAPRVAALRALSIELKARTLPVWQLAALTLASEVIHELEDETQRQEDDNKDPP